MKKVVISSFGSSGDFNPCLGLGRALRARGVEVLFLSNPFFEKVITEAGLQFVPSGEYLDVFKMISDNPDFLHPRKGPRAVGQMVLEVLPVMYRDMTKVIEDHKPDLVACHILEYGGMLAARSKSIPYATLCPTPMGWFTKDQPGYFNYPELGLWLRRIQAGGIRLLMNFGLMFIMRLVCRKEGIGLNFRSIDDVYGKSILNLGLWSEVLREAGKDDPPNSRICGFVRDDHIRDWPDVPGAIAELFAGDKRPVVAGLGSTASLHGDAIYENVAKVCGEIDRSCLLIGKDLGKYADRQRSIMAVDFAPYGWVFPRAGMVIHHGGLNTTAETLRAGVPGLVVPHAYDQFDNAIRCGKMGVAKKIKVRQAAGGRLGDVIRGILDDGQMKARAKEVSQELCGKEDGGEVAAERIIEAIS